MMKTYWDQKLSYRENYDRFVTDVEKDKRDWIVDQEPPKDGTQLYFLCANDWQDQRQYDIGYWADYRERTWFIPDSERLEGEWDTEFGNCEEILGWKYVETPQ